MTNKDVKTEGGTFIEGDVNTGRDFAGRDIDNSRITINGNTLIAVIALLIVGITIVLLILRFDNQRPANTSTSAGIQAAIPLVKTPSATDPMLLLEANRTMLPSMPTIDSTIATTTEIKLHKLIQDWNLIYSDDFNQDLLVWETGKRSDEYGIATRSIIYSVYQWETRPVQEVIWESIVWTKREDITIGHSFILSATGRQTGGATSSYGLLFRLTDGYHYYLFEIRDNQEYAIMVKSGKTTPIVNWTKSAAIIPGENNKLTVLGEGTHFTFFINDTYVAEIEDDTFATGKAGLGIMQFSTYQPAYFHFDNFSVAIPDQKGN